MQRRPGRVGLVRADGVAWSGGRRTAQGRRSIGAASPPGWGSAGAAGAVALGLGSSWATSRAGTGAPPDNVLTSVLSGLCWSARRRSTCAASSIDHRESGSRSIIRCSAGSRKSARWGCGGWPWVMSCSTATGLLRCSYGEWPSTAAYNVAPSAHTSVPGARVATAGELGGEVARRAGEEAGLGQGGVAVGAGDPEVADLGHAVLADQHVAGLDVTMHRSGGMCGGKAGRDLGTDLGDCSRVERAVLLDDLGERPTRDVLHHQPDVAGLLDDVEDRDHVAVAQCSRGAGFAEGARGVGDRLVGQQADLLDGDVALQGLVAAQPDSAHAALADRRLHAVSAADQLRLHRILSLVVRDSVRWNVPSHGRGTPERPWGRLGL